MRASATDRTRARAGRPGVARHAGRRRRVRSDAARDGRATGPGAERSELRRAASRAARAAGRRRRRPPNEPAGGSGRPRRPAAAAEPESTTPARSTAAATGRPSSSYEIGGGRRRDLKLQAVRSRQRRGRAGAGGRNVEPRHRAHGPLGRHPGRGGTCKGSPCFGSASGGGASTASAPRATVRFRIYTHKFPVRGRHQYWDGYGAGRGHKGQDVFAKCGTTLVAARAGKVQWRGYQAGGAGYYIVVDGKGTSKDYVYMHLRRRPARDGREGKTGERIGRVGRSGNATGCHLHFELWKGRLVRRRPRDAVGHQAPEEVGPLGLARPAAASALTAAADRVAACEPRRAFPASTARPATTRASTSRPRGPAAGGRLAPPHRPQAARARSRARRCG